MIIVFGWARLKDSYYNKPQVWSSLLKSIENSAAKAGYAYEASYFELESNKSFKAGDSEVAIRLARYCNNKWNSEETDIKDYPEVMKDLCT